jgi:hypothetical protein
MERFFKRVTPFPEGNRGINYTILKYVTETGHMYTMTTGLSPHWTKALSRIETIVESTDYKEITEDEMFLELI